MELKDEPIPLKLTVYFRDKRTKANKKEAKTTKNDVFFFMLGTSNEKHVHCSMFSAEKTSNENRNNKRETTEKESIQNKSRRFEATDGNSGDTISHNDN